MCNELCDNNFVSRIFKKKKKWGGVGGSLLYVHILKEKIVTILKTCNRLMLTAVTTKKTGGEILKRRAVIDTLPHRLLSACFHAYIQRSF